MFNEKGNIIQNKDIVMREEEDGAFLFDPNTGRICYLNGLGIHIWKWCEEPHTPADIMVKTVSAYPDIPEDQIQRDCLDFLQELERLECISIGPPA